MAILNVLSVFAVDNGAITDLENGGGISQYFTEISSYRDSTFEVNGITYYNNELSAPKGYENYIFAGWYNEANCTTTLGSDVTSGEAYAKFVPKEIMGIKAQIEAITGFGSDDSSIRFVTSVDSLKYQTVGFDFELNGQKLNSESNSVYKRLEAKGADDRVLNYTPSRLFHTMSKYFMACTVINVQNKDFGHGIFVKPYWITNDGTKVYGDQDMKTINMGYMPYATAVTAGLATSNDGIERPNNTQASSQGGCTDGTYYYQATLCDVKSVTADNAATTGTTKIQRYELNNDGDWVLDATSSNMLPLAHANDMTYNPNLTYNDQNGSGLLVVCQNEPVWKRVSFVDPSTLDIVEPSKVTSLDGTTKGWNAEATDLQYMELSMPDTVKYGIFSIDYSATHDKYVVGVAGTKNFYILDSSMQIVGDVKTTNNVPTAFANQGVGSDDSYIYFVYYNNPNSPVNGYDTHVIAVYDWDGNAVTVMNISKDDIAVGGSNTTTYEPENISIYNNTIYLGCSRWIPILSDTETFVFKVDGMNLIESKSVATIARNDEVFGYFTLEDAMADAQKDETIVLHTDVTVDSTMDMLASNVTLTTDVVEGVTVTRTKDVTMLEVAEGASFTIDGKVALDGNKEAINGSKNLVLNNGTFTLGTDATIQNARTASASAVLNASGTLNLYGTLSGNVGTGSGGAVRVNGGVLNVDGARFVENIAKYGGAIYAKSADVQINISNNATFTGNSTTYGGYGGAIHFVEISGATIDDSTFNGNTCDANVTNHVGGGAIYLQSSKLISITDSTFNNNASKTTSDGGAINCRNSTMTATGCTFNGNSSESGNGAIYNFKNGSNTSIVALESCTFINDTVVTNAGKTTVSGDMKMTGKGFLVATKTSSTAAREVEIGDEGLTGRIIITPNSYDTNEKYAVGGAIANNADKVEVTLHGGFPYEVTAEGKLDLKGKLKNAEAAIGPENCGTLEAMIAEANETATATLANPVEITVLKNITTSGAYSVTGHVRMTTIPDRAVTITRNTAIYMFQVGNADNKGTGSLAIDGKITIDGNQSVDGTGTNLILHYGEALSIGADVIVQNSTSKNGPAIYSQYGKVTLKGTFKGHTYSSISSITKSGGVLRATAGTVYIEGTEDKPVAFTGNQGRYGGAIRIEGATLYVNHAVFNNNTARDYGGAIFINDGSTVHIQNTEFTSNESKSTSISGGAIYIVGRNGSSKLTLEDCQFKDNIAKVAGTAICNDGGTVNISDCSFVNDTYAHRKNSPNTVLSGKITGLTIADLDAHRPVQIGAGGLKVGSDVTKKMKSNTVDAIVLSKGTGATDAELARAAELVKISQSDPALDTWYYINSQGKLAQGTEEGAATAGTAEDLKTMIENADGPSTIYITASMTISDTITVQRNITLKSFSNVTLTRGANKTMFSVTVAGSLTIGGWITVDGANLEATTILINNSGTFTLGTGATVQNAKTTGTERIIYSNSTTTITNIYGVLKNNDSGKEGVIRAKGTVNVDGALFENNKSTRGGAIYLDSGATATIQNSVFRGNGKTGADAGAIYLEGALEVTNSTFIDNVGTSGGAIYVNNSNASLKLNQTSFVSNEATYGGAVRITKGTLDVNGGNFEQNESEQGGAIRVNSSVTVTIDDATFTGNKSTNAGGGAIYSEAALTVATSTFTSNTAVTLGGAIHCQKANLTVTDCSFTENYAGGTATEPEFGGAIRVNGTSAAHVTATISGGTFTSNTAVENGGAISSNYADLTVNNGCTFSGNSAAQGNAIHTGNDADSATESTITIDDSCGVDEGDIYQEEWKR